MKTWIKLALLSVVAVMLAACGEKEKIPLPYALQSDRIWHSLLRLLYNKVIKRLRHEPNQIDII